MAEQSELTATELKTPSFYVKHHGDHYDCTSYIGPLFAEKNVAWPMYSYERPGSILWNAIAGELNKRGWTDDEIKAWLASKEPRWALDGSLGDAVQALGVEFAKSIDDGAKRYATMK
jgi:hypothetical protein